MMRLRLIYLICAFFLPLLSAPALAAGEFKANNPDGGKYEFLRSHIAALSYLNHIDERWAKKPPKKVFAGDDIKVIRGHIAYLTMDNADLRITKSYLEKYLEARNPLMRKVADTVALACNTEIVLNDQEKQMWMDWLGLKLTGRATPEEEKKFIAAQQQSAFEHKEADKKIIEASIFAATVAKSIKNANEHGHLLALTSREREKLLDRLDAFAKGMLDWGLKPGQRTVEASVAVIREVLEDPVYKSMNE